MANLTCVQPFVGPFLWALVLVMVSSPAVLGTIGDSNSSTETANVTNEASNRSHLILQSSATTVLKAVAISGVASVNGSANLSSPAPVLANSTTNTAAPTTSSTLPPSTTASTTPTAPSTTPTTPTTALPNSAAEEQHSSMKLFFILLVIALCILVTHILLVTKFHYLPESVAVVIVGAIIGLILKSLSQHHMGNWESAESFPPTVFFLVILPPIIFESGYNLHKGNFFANIGTILVFAILGTIISAVVVGGGIYLLGLAGAAYPLTVVESFAFGSLISAIDPVATLAIFHALDVEPVLYMLVFGESVLNDAVSIVLTTTVIEMGSPAMAAVNGASLFIQGVGRFCLMFFASAAIGVVFGLISALLLKYVDLRRTPSLEIGMILIFSYLPYGLAEGLQLSGIMAILFTGIVMSHYTHLNLSPITQITVQQTFRTVSFMAETCVFAYLGLAISSFDHTVEVPFVIWSIILCLIGRAVNIFPLALLVNYFREHKITKKMQFIMWFSGLRGAIAFALSLHLETFDEAKRQVVKTTTLIIVLFTILVLGGSTMPIMKFVNRIKPSKKKFRAEKRRQVRELTLSKTREMGNTVDSDHLSAAGMTSDEESHPIKKHLKGFVKFDLRYVLPFLTRKLTTQEVREGRKQMSSLTEKWYRDVRSHAADDDDGDGLVNRALQDSDDEEETEIHFTRSENGRQLIPLTAKNYARSNGFTNEHLRPSNGSVERSSPKRTSPRHDAPSLLPTSISAEGLVPSASGDLRRGSLRGSGRGRGKPPSPLRSTNSVSTHSRLPPLPASTRHQANFLRRGEPRTESDDDYNENNNNMYGDRLELERQALL